MNISIIRLFSVTVFAFIFFITVRAQKQQKYEWKSVPVNGGGFVPGIIFNPTEKGLLYARTDVGGAYIWNNEKIGWDAITDGFDNFNDLGNVSLASDPVETNRVYLATGLYYQSWWSEMASVYASIDKGKTWTSVKLPFKLGGNTPGRGSGERLRVDPNSNNILYLGSQKDGLWKSENYGKSWKKVPFNFDNITFVEFLKSSGKKGEPTPVIYVGICDQMYNNKFQPAIYQSKDAGKTWEAIPGQPIQLDPKPVPADQTPAHVPMPCVANRVALCGDYMYVAYGNSHTPNGDYEMSYPGNNVHNGAIYKYNIKTGEWKNITPYPESMGGYSGVTVHPTNPDIVAVISVCRWAQGDEIFISGDGGKTWKNVLYKDPNSNKEYKAIMDYSKAPYVHDHHPHWTTDLEMDPFNPNRAIFGTGYGVFVCYNFLDALEDKPTTWVFEDNGLEETAVLEIKSPPMGPILITAIGDFDGFVHYDLNSSPKQGKHFPNRGTNNSIDFAGLKPEIMVRTHDNGDSSLASYSINAGKTWNQFPKQPAKLIKNGGQIAVSADGKIILWSPDKIGVYTTWDLGKTWHRSKIIPVNSKPVADKVDPSTFYAKENSSGTIFISNDSGQTFTARGAAVGKGNGNIESVFGEKGNIWAACGDGGLWFSKNGGIKFKQIMNVTVCKNVSFGKAAPDANYPTIFIHGTVNNVLGLFRSDDMGKTWIRINDNATNFGRSHRTISGDPRVYGRLYIGTEGRGVMYGDIAK